MPANQRKPQPSLSKPSEGESFNPERKPTSSPTNPLGSGGLSVTAERELGTVGGIKSTAKLTVGVDDLIGQQGIDIEIDSTNRTAGFGVGIGSTKGKLGVNIGGKVGYDEDGNLSVKGAEVGVNVAGFGGSASIDEDEGIRGSISAAGAKVEIGIRTDGKKTVSLCYGVPGGEVCVTFEPDEDIETPTPTPTPIPTPTPNDSTPEGVDVPDSDVQGWVFVHIKASGINLPYQGFGSSFTERKILSPIEERLGGFVGRAPMKLSSQVKRIIPNPTTFDEVIIEKNGVRLFVHQVPVYNAIAVRNPETGFFENKEIIRQNASSIYLTGDKAPLFFWGSFKEIRRFLKINNEENKIKKEVFPENYSENIYIPFACIPYYGPVESPPLPPPPTNKIQLPNHPQHLKRMKCDCCDKVEEIYKYLGIAKLKRNKFPVSNAFLVPGGSGNDNCFDYYAIVQALFRMLANGLIINPKSKPLGSEWQSTNATAWASAMYEMMAESMSDGNTSQRFEVAAIMQLTQIMATLAENGRKIEFVADAIGLEPMPVAENVPVCFTIYEGHKGFGKKEPKKINISGLKTDNDVENVLGKMLNPSLIPITAWKFKPGQISINEALRNG
jgi:hypothetical protein